WPHANRNELSPRRQTGTSIPHLTAPFIYQARAHIVPRRDIGHPSARLQGFGDDPRLLSGTPAPTPIANRGDFDCSVRHSASLRSLRALYDRIVGISMEPNKAGLAGRLRRHYRLEKEDGAVLRCLVWVVMSSRGQPEIELAG